MAELAHPAGAGAHGPETSRRDFLTLTAATTGVIGAAIAVWPFIDSLNPAKDTLALSTTEVDLGPIALGQRVTVVWQGKPVFIDHRPPEAIKKAQEAPLDELRDRQKDSERVKKPEWLILVGVCTHLGCIPLG